ncbi:unnamed protein product [Amoebophrya sp. A25]|nr:unnamed protein product [Amoebophrya sp. A25]|eukprot:GSA25T00009076001.1
MSRKPLFARKFQAAGTLLADDAPVSPAARGGERVSSSKVEPAWLSSLDHAEGLLRLLDAATVREEYFSVAPGSVEHHYRTATNGDLQEDAASGGIRGAASATVSFHPTSAVSVEGARSMTGGVGVLATHSHGGVVSGTGVSSGLATWHRVKRFISSAVFYRDQAKEKMQQLEKKLCRYREFEHLEQQIHELKARRLELLREVGTRERNFGEDLGVSSKLRTLQQRAVEWQDASVVLKRLVFEEKQVCDRARRGLKLLQGFPAPPATSVLDTPEDLAMWSPPGDANQVSSEGHRTTGSANVLVHRSVRLLRDRYCVLAVFEKEAEIAKDTGAGLAAYYLAEPASGVESSSAPAAASATTSSSATATSATGSSSSSSAARVFLILVYDIGSNKVYLREARPSRKDLLCGSTSAYVGGLLRKIEFSSAHATPSSSSTVQSPQGLGEVSASLEIPRTALPRPAVAHQGLRELSNGSALGYFHVMVHVPEAIDAHLLVVASTSSSVGAVGPSSQEKGGQQPSQGRRLVRLFDAATCALHTISLPTTDADPEPPAHGTKPDSQGTSALLDDDAVFEYFVQQLQYDGQTLRVLRPQASNKLENFVSLESNAAGAGGHGKNKEEDSGTAGKMGAASSSAANSRGDGSSKESECHGALEQGIVVNITKRIGESRQYCLLRGAVLEEDGSSKLGVILYDPLTEGRWMCERLFDLNNVVSGLGSPTGAPNPAAITKSISAFLEKLEFNPERGLYVS